MGCVKSIPLEIGWPQDTTDFSHPTGPDDVVRAGLFADLAVAALHGEVDQARFHSKRLHLTFFAVLDRLGTAALLPGPPDGRGRQMPTDEGDGVMGNGGIARTHARTRFDAV